MFRNRSSATPIVEATLTVYVLDSRPLDLTLEQIHSACGTTQHNYYLCVFYNEDLETYDIKQNGSGTELKITDINLSQEELHSYIAQINQALAKRRVIVTGIRLCCYPNLGRADTACISEDMHLLTRALKPKSLLLIIDGDEDQAISRSPDYCLRTCGEIEKRADLIKTFSLGIDTSREVVSNSLGKIVHKSFKLENDMNAYFQRHYTQMNYISSEAIEHGAWTYVNKLRCRIENPKQAFLELEHALDTLMALPKLPESVIEPRTLTVYVLSQRYANDNGRLATLLSTAHHEQSIFTIYHQNDKTYEIAQIHVVAPCKKERTEETIVGIPIPKSPMPIRHFIEYLRVMKSHHFLNFYQIRLCTESTLEENETRINVSTIVNDLVHAIRPDYLYLISEPESTRDASTYLLRQTTNAGFSLPMKDMKGHCIPAAYVQGLLAKTDPKVSISKDKLDIETTKMSEYRKQPDLLREVQNCFNSNIIPILHNLPHEQSLTPCSPREMAGSNKSLRLFRPDPSPAAPSRIQFGEVTVQNFIERQPVEQLGLEENNDDDENNSCCCIIA